MWHCCPTFEVCFHQVGDLCSLPKLPVFTVQCLMLWGWVSCRSRQSPYLDKSATRSPCEECVGSLYLLQKFHPVCQNCNLEKDSFNSVSISPTLRGHFVGRYQMMESTRPSHFDISCNSRPDLVQAIASPEVLSPSLWSSLPAELLERVLAFLPFPNLFRLRSVCRRWNSLPHCSYFRQIRASAPNQWGACLPVLFCKDASKDKEDEGWNSDSWSAYDTAANEWLRLPPLTCLDARHPKYLVVGSGGLLCTGDFDSTENLVVCNPVTRCFRELPPSLGKWAEPDLTAMAIEKCTGGYRLVLAGNRSFNPGELGYRTTEIYNSATRAWATMGNIPANLELHSQEGALCNHVLYCLARDLKQGVWNTLAAYDLVSGNWTIVSQNVPHGSRTPHVIGSNDQILVVAERHDPVMDSECVILFQLDLVTKKWREISRLPNELYVGIGKRVIACTVDGDYMCVTGCSSSRWFSAMYRSSQNKWQQVPAFPVDESKGRELCELLLSSSPFRPSLEPV